MSLVTQKDRDIVQAMHHAANGTGSRALDVSRKRSSDDSSYKPLWTKPPSLIQPPGSQRYHNSRFGRQSAAGSPFQQSQFNDLHDNVSRGNPSAVALVQLPARQISTMTYKSIRSDNAPFPKRKRLEKATMALHNSMSRGDRSGSAIGSPSLSKHKLQEGNLTSSSSHCESSNGGVHNFRSSIPVTSDDSLRLPTPTTQSEVIDLDEGEDLGVPIPRASIGSLPQTPSNSSDDLRLTSTHDNIDSDSGGNSVGEILGLPKPSDKHAFSQALRSHNIRPLPSAGPHTRAVMTQVRNHRPTTNGTDIYEPELIEDADEFDTSLHTSDPSSEKNTQSQPTFAPHHVRDKISLFERWNRPRELDLRNAGKNKSRVASMKKKELMSGQRGPQAFNLGKPSAAARQDRLPPAPPSISLTNYKTSRRHVLPLEAYACGNHIYESVDSEDPTPKYWLRVQDHHMSIMHSPIESGHVLVDLELGQDIRGVSLPETSTNIKDFPLLILTLRQTEKTSSFFGRTVDNESQEKMIIMIKPLVSHVNWSVDQFKSICGLIKLSGNTGMAHLGAAVYRSQWNCLLQVPHVTSDQPQQQVTRSRPHPQPTYAGAAQSSYSSTSFDVRRSSRQTSSRKSPHSPSPPGDEIILLYPPTGTGAVNVTNGDLKRLEPGEFLNDTLIELGLKLWLYDLRVQRPEFADQVHVFSSFFYTQLNHKNFEEGYQSVRKWTSKFDLFKKKYIVVPINEHMHWYLAIICHPERALQHPSAHAVTPNVTTRTRAQGSLAMRNNEERSIHYPDKSTPTRPPSSKGSTVSAQTLTEDEQEVEHAVHMSPAQASVPTRPTSPYSSVSSLSSVTAQPDYEPEAMGTVPATDSERENSAMVVDESMEPTSSSRMVPSIAPVPSKNFYEGAGSAASTSRNGMRIENDGEEEVDQLQDDDHMDVDAIPSPAVEHLTPDVPYIFSFDSLGTRHPHALKVLARYLDMEAKDKKGWADAIQPAVKRALVPAQPNYCDCGVYLLHFVEQFMSDPDTFSQQILQQKSKKAAGPSKSERERLWSHDKVAGRREEMKQKIISLSAEWRQERQADSKGKEKEGIEDQPREATTVSVDPDSDIEVVEISPKPSKAVKPTRTNKAARLR